MSRKLSGTVFILSQITLLTLGLMFITWLYFFLQIQSATVRKTPPPAPGSKPITLEPSTFTLEMTAPEDDFLSFKDEILVSGQTQKNLQVLISSSDHDLVLKSDTSGYFSTNFPLIEGVNDIKIAVFDPTGDSRTVEKIVYYSKEKI